MDMRRWGQNALQQRRKESSICKGNTTDTMQIAPDDLAHDGVSVFVSPSVPPFQLSPSSIEHSPPDHERPKHSTPYQLTGGQILSIEKVKHHQPRLRFLPACRSLLLGFLVVPQPIIKKKLL